jgi:hypothetical protein
MNEISQSDADRRTGRAETFRNRARHELIKSLPLNYKEMTVSEWVIYINKENRKSKHRRMDS